MDKQIDDYINSTSEDNDTFYELGQPLWFWLFFIFDVFAILCSVFTLYHLLTKRTLRQALRNQSLILMLLFGLVYELIDIPLHLQFLSTGTVRPATPQLCMIWWFIDWGFYYTIEILLLFISIERHILIFHSQILATKRKRFLVHYLPMLLIVLFIMTFYSIAIFSPICVNTYEYTSDLCGMYACYSTVPFFAMLEQMGFSTTSSCFIGVFNISLLIRVIWQKHRVRRSIQWRKQRKLAIQVILMSLLFLIFSLPLTIIYLVRLFGQPDWAMEVFSSLFYFSYFAVLFLPFVCLVSLPELRDKLKVLHLRRRRRQIAAVTVL